MMQRTYSNKKIVFTAVAPLALVLAAASATQPRPAPTPPRATSTRHFDTYIAPLMARHCLPCHDSTSKKGGLDLSLKAAALKGGVSGRVIVPGKAAESLLWKHVASGTMPPRESPRLSEQEKRALRQWIEGGAVWSGTAIGPLTHRGERTAAQNWLRRLTVPEYIETVRSALGVDIEREARRLLPPDTRADGFTNTAYNLKADLAHVEAYARLAEIIGGRMDAAAFASRYTKSRALTPANMRTLIAGMGKWLLRGPLTPDEISGFLRVSSVVAKDGGDFAEAARCIVEAMLQSPRFVYRIEAQPAPGKSRRVNGYELASRLSYTLWGGPPDRELLRAAEAGELTDRTRVGAQVSRMLKDPRAVKKSLQFIREWLDLDRLVNLRPNPKRFPAWNDRLATDMREETLAFFKHVVWEQKRPLSALMNAQVTFATPRLAAHYGLEPKLTAGVSKNGLQALYTFREGSGNTVRDTSGAGEPLDLHIEGSSAVRWGKGRLAVNDSTLIATARPSKRLTDAVKKSKALTIEAWITPAAKNQSGPARIITLSSGPSERNVTLGQDGDRYDVRFRAARTDGNGQPSLGGATGAMETRLTQVVYTRDAAGKARLFVNGDEQSARDIGADLANWSDGFRLGLANEMTKDRPWRGVFHLVAIYSRAFTQEEVRSRAAGLSRYDLTSVPGRGGLLTQGSLLTVGGDDASMVTRGLFILNDLLYSKVGSAPPGVDTTPVPPKPGMSRRAVAETRLTNAACSGCHSKFEPLAFGLEKFDGVGAYHASDEHGNRLREDGQITFPGQSKPVSYKTADEFMDLLAGSERVRKNITRKLTQFALGRPLVSSDAPLVDRIHQAAHKSGGTYNNVMTAIALSDLIQMTTAEKTQ